MARLYDEYKQSIAPALMTKFGYKSVMQIPKLDKVVINVGAIEFLYSFPSVDISHDPPYLLKSCTAFFTNAIFRAVFVDFCTNAGWLVAFRANYLYFASIDSALCFNNT